MKRFGRLSLACTLLVGLLSCHVQAAEAEAGAKATKQPTRLGKALSHQIDGFQGHSLAAVASVKPAAYRGKIEKPAGHQVTEHMSQSYSGPTLRTYPGTAGDSIQQTAQGSYSAQDSYNAQNSYNANPGYPSRVPQASHQERPSAYSIVPGADQLGRYHQSGYGSKAPSQGNAAAPYPGSSQGTYGQGTSYAAGSYKNNPAAGSYGSMPYAQPAPYNQQYGAGYQSGPQDRASYTLTPPQEPYAPSYQTPGAAYAPHNSCGMGSEYPDTTPLNPSRGYANPQQPLRGAKKAAADGAGKPAPKQHHPTVVHQEDPYRQQQLQQQQVLNALSNSNAVLGNAVLDNSALSNAVLGSAMLGKAGLGNGPLAIAALGSSGYGGMYKQTNPTGYSNSKATDPEAQLWWKDHQQLQLQPGQKQPTAMEKLDALVSIINKLGN